MTGTAEVSIPPELIRAARQHGAKSAAVLAGMLAKREGVDLRIAIESLTVGYDRPVSAAADDDDPNEIVLALCPDCRANPMEVAGAKSLTDYGRMLVGDRMANGKCPGCGEGFSRKRESGSARPIRLTARKGSNRREDNDDRDD